jgi:shikimate kinase
MAMNTATIILVGFMGSGKSTVGRELADQLRWDFVDIDKIIEDREGMSIKDIFKTKGEQYFRRLEAKVLREFLSRRAIVIATGGGAFAQKGNHQLMLRSGLVVWPFVPLRIIKKRLSSREERRNRPLLKRPPKEIRELFDDRRLAYRDAHLIVNGVGTPKEIAEDIIGQRRKYY